MERRDDLKTAINHAVKLLNDAIKTETTQVPVMTIAAMAHAEGTLRTVAAFLDTIPIGPISPPPAPETTEFGNWETFGRAVEGRRQWLSMTQFEVTKSGGPSEQTLRRIENAQRCRYKAGTFVHLETALRWPAGTCAGILAGRITNIDELITAPWISTQGETERTK